MANFTGQDGTVEVDTNTFGELTSWSVEETDGTHDTTVIGSSARTRKAMSIPGWSGSAEAFFDLDDTAQALLTPGSSVVLTFYHEGNTATNNYLTGTGIITQRSVSSGTEDMVTVSFSFEGNGALTEATV